MNCIQCGNAIDNDAAWCPNCGSRVDNQPVQTQPVQPVAQPEAQQFTQPVTQPMQPQYSNPVSQTTTSFDSVPASDPAPAFDPAPAPAPVKMSKKTKIILSVVGVLVVILGLTYYFVQKMCILRKLQLSDTLLLWKMETLRKLAILSIGLLATFQMVLVFL